MKTFNKEDKNRVEMTKQSPQTYVAISPVCINLPKQPASTNKTSLCWITLQSTQRATTKKNKQESNNI